MNSIALFSWEISNYNFLLVMVTFSVIIPTLNEAHNIGRLIPYLKSLDASLEIIVVDGGSNDGTIEQVGEQAILLRSGRGRAVQMNEGARRASGEILWFLHADCIPHHQSIESMRRVLKNPRIVGGAFEYLLDQPGWIYRLTEFLSNRKNKRLKLLYGDMGIFIRKDVFQAIGGYPEIPLMEDMALCTAMKKYGEIVILPQRIVTSARRWVEEGPIKNMVRNWLLRIAYKLGASPVTLARWYRFK